jgi:hypothetical protein
LTTANAVRKTSSKATDSVKTLRRFGASSWANKVLYFRKNDGKDLSPG